MTSYVRLFQSLDPNEMLAHIGNVRQAVKFASSDLPPGQEELPGFCLPKKVRDR